MDLKCAKYLFFWPGHLQVVFPLVPYEVIMGGVDASSSLRCAKAGKIGRHDFPIDQVELHQADMKLCSAFPVLQ